MKIKAELWEEGEESMMSINIRKNLLNQKNRQSTGWRSSSSSIRSIEISDIKIRK
jgi:hypothetical protein